MKLSFQKYTLSLLASLVLVSCAKDYALVGTEREKGGAPIWLSTSVTVQTLALQELFPMIRFLQVLLLIGSPEW